MNPSQRVDNGFQSRHNADQMNGFQSQQYTGQRNDSQPHYNASQHDAGYHSDDHQQQQQQDTGQLSGMQNPRVGGQANGMPPHSTGSPNSVNVVCGPLINYQHMTYHGQQATWHGSVLIVTEPTSITPRLEYGPAESRGETNTVEALKLYQDPDKAFWRFSLELPLSDVQTEWSYLIHNLRFLSDVRNKDGRRFFFVPGSNESMRIMFHSCNGFSVGTDEDFWSGMYSTVPLDDPHANRSRSCSLERCSAYPRKETLSRHDRRRRSDL